jgi:hypothetical protein
MMTQHLREQLERLEAAWPTLSERDQELIATMLDALCVWVEAGKARS